MSFKGTLSVAWICRLVPTVKNANEVTLYDVHVCEVHLCEVSATLSNGHFKNPKKICKQLTRNCGLPIAMSEPLWRHIFQA